MRLFPGLVVASARRRSSALRARRGGDPFRPWRRSRPFRPENRTFGSRSFDASRRRFDSSRRLVNAYLRSHDELGEYLAAKGIVAAAKTAKVDKLGVLYCSGVPICAELPPVLKEIGGPAGVSVRVGVRRGIVRDA